MHPFVWGARAAATSARGKSSSRVRRFSSRSRWKQNQYVVVHQPHKPGAAAHVTFGSAAQPA